MMRGFSIIFNDDAETLKYLKEFAKRFIKTEQVYIPLFDKLSIKDDESEVIDNPTIYYTEMLLSSLSSTRQLLFLEMFGFYHKSTLSLLDYEDFINSDYTFTMLCFDNVYFDIYVKDKQLLEDIINLLKQ